MSVYALLAENTGGGLLVALETDVHLLTPSEADAFEKNANEFVVHRVRVAIPHQHDTRLKHALETGAACARQSLRTRGLAQDTHGVFVWWTFETTRPIEDESAGLLGACAFAMARLRQVQADVVPVRVAATGRVSPSGRVQRVAHLGAKLRAALAFEPAVRLILYPKEQASEVQQLVAQAYQRGIFLCPVETVDEALGILLRVGDPAATSPPPEALMPPPTPMLAKALEETAATVLRPELQGGIALVAVLLTVLAPTLFPSLAWKVGLLVGVFIVVYLLPVFASRRSRERLADLVTTHRVRFSAGALLIFALGIVLGYLITSQDPQPPQPLLDPRFVQIPPELLGAMPAVKCRLSPRQVERAPSRIERILQRGHLVVRIQDPQSFEAQLLSAVAKKWDTPVTWVTTTQGDGAQALQSGALDILATHVVHTIQADQKIDFSQTYLVGAQGEPYAFGVPPGETTFRLLLDYTLQELGKTGDYDTLVRAAFPQSPRTFQLDILPSQLGSFRLRDHAAPESHLRTSVFTDIQTKHCLNVGVRYDFAPYSYLDAHGEFAGFDVDLVKAIAHKWGLSPTAIAFRPLAAQDRALFQLMGMVDLVAAGFTRNNERERYLDFSQTYFIDTQGILVQTKAKLRQICDLQGKSVAITQGSTAIQNLKEEYARRCGGTMAINLVVSIADALAQLQTGEAHGIATNTVVLQAIANADPRFTVLPYTFSREPAGLGVPQNDTLLRDQVNATLQELLRDGTYAAIYCKHFGTRPLEPLELWPRTAGEVPQLPPTACDERAKAAPPPTTYVVKSGDTLYKIAATYLESPFCWTWLRDSNAIPEDKQDHLEIGKTLLIAAEPKRGCASKSKN